MMKTRYSPLVSIKKNDVEKVERELQEAHSVVRSAKTALENSLEELLSITPPKEGLISSFLANRTMLEAQRKIVEKNEQWVVFAKEQLHAVQKKLQAVMIEYEKFKYLELQEIEAIKKQHKLQEAKDLDEIALLTFKKQKLGA
jgi:flagellar biosynthesis chaperone FliJ